MTAIMGTPPLVNHRWFVAATTLPAQERVPGEGEFHKGDSSDHIDHECPAPPHLEGQVQTFATALFLMGRDHTYCIIQPERDRCGVYKVHR